LDQPPRVNHVFDELELVETLHIELYPLHVVVLKPCQHDFFDEDKISILGDLMLAETKVPFLLTIGFQCFKGLRKHALLAAIVVISPSHTVPTNNCPPLVDYSALLVDLKDFSSHISRPLSSYGLIPEYKKAGFPLDLQLDSTVLAYFKFLSYYGKT
jgi:hypothetical protein